MDAIPKLLGIKLTLDRLKGCSKQSINVKKKNYTKNVNINVQ